MTGDDFAAQIERFAALLPPMTERIPSRIKMTPATYAAVALTAAERPKYGGPSRFDAVPVFIDDEIDAPWIAYDQHGEEMGRG